MSMQGLVVHWGRGFPEQREVGRVQSASGCKSGEVAGGTKGKKGDDGEVRGLGLHAVSTPQMQCPDV